MATNSTSEELTAHQRLSRLLNMGEYGERLATEILEQYWAERFDKQLGEIITWH